MGEYAFHSESQWRLRGPNGMVTGKGDWVWPSGVSPDDDAGWEWDMEGCSRSDDLLDAYFESVADNPPIVQLVEVDEVAGVAIHLSDGHTLEVFPNDTRGGEEWRLLKPGDTSSHFVIEGGQVAEDVDWA